MKITIENKNNIPKKCLQRKSRYDAVLERAMELKGTETLKIELETPQKALNTSRAIRLTIKARSFSLDCVSRDKNVFIFKKDEPT